MAIVMTVTNDKKFEKTYSGYISSKRETEIDFRALECFLGCE